MGVTLPIDIYEALEKQLGKEDAKKVVKSLEATISENIEHTWVKTKTELVEEMEKKFVTKADFKVFRSEFRLYFIVLLFTIIIVNPRSLEIIGKLLGIIK